MLKPIFLALTTAILFSCSGENETNSTTENTASFGTDEPEQMADNEDSLETAVPAEPTPFFLDDFPRNWLQVDIGEGGEYFIQHYCDAEVASIRISPEKGEDWTLYTGWGQDGEIQTLQNFEASSITSDEVETVTGTFQVYREYDGALSDVSFIWTKDDMICEFVGLNFQSPLFVVEDEADRVEHIEEDCEDFWE